MLVALVTEPLYECRHAAEAWILQALLRHSTKSRTMSTPDLICRIRAFGIDLERILDE